MKVSWNRDAGLLTYDRADGSSVTIPVASVVRNELNGLRSLSEHPVYSENEDRSQGVPYMPRQFPRGDWHVLGVEDAEGAFLAPAIVRTDAHQSVEAWSEVHSQGEAHAVRYGGPTGRTVEDWGYLLHDSSSMYTLGCGRHNTENVCPDAAPGVHETEEGRAFRAEVRAALAAAEAAGADVKTAIPLQVV